MALLKGNRVDLRIMEKEDFAQWHAWFQDSEVVGPYVGFSHMRPWYEAEKNYAEPKNPGLEFTRYFMQKKDGTKIGGIAHFWGSQVFSLMEVGYFTIPSERGHGYTTEALQIMVDYLFLSRNLERIQATTDTRNVGSHRVLEKAGFQREGLLRKTGWNRGRLTDLYIWSIIRDDWKAPRVLKDPATEAGDSTSRAGTPPTGTIASR